MRQFGGAASLVPLGVGAACLGVGGHVDVPRAQQPLDHVVHAPVVEEPPEERPQLQAGLKPQPLRLVVVAHGRDVVRHPAVVLRPERPHFLGGEHLTTNHKPETVEVLELLLGAQLQRALIMAWGCGDEAGGSLAGAEGAGDP